MGAVYGFKSNNAGDATAITNALLQADTIDEKSYDTLAQYTIKDVELKPASLSFGLPRQWMLTLNTSLIGMNKPDGQAVYFDEQNKDSTVGDGYVTYELGLPEFQKMLDGGLYVNPLAYSNKLKESLRGQQFFRQTRANLTTVRVLDSHLDIAVGDLREQEDTGHEYLIGKDVQAYETFTPEQSKQSNLDQVLGKSFNDLAAIPITMKRDFDAEKLAAQSTQIEMPELPDVHVNQEVNMALSTQSDLIKNGNSDAPISAATQDDFGNVSGAESDVQVDAGETNVTPFLKQSSAPADLQAVDVKSDVATGAVKNAVSESMADDNDNGGNDQPVDVNDLMDKLNQASTANAKRVAHSHAYVDDFAGALQSSHQNQQKKLQKTQRTQRQESDELGR